VAGQGYFVLTYTSPGKKKKTRNLSTHEEVAQITCSLPVGTKIWIMVPALNLGYGMEVREPGVAY
jgi:hypothetical protein